MQSTFPIFQIAYLILIAIMVACQAKSSNSEGLYEAPLVLGNEQMDEYLPHLTGKRVGLVVNQSSILGNSHLVDTLIASGIAVKMIFSPEHGFRGEAADGVTVLDGKDAKTNLPIISLYGKVKKPTPEHLTNLDIVVFDIQDVGTRFYTFLSTMHLVMEACAENNVPFIVLDKPNPNGAYIDGPILDKAYKSFVGMHPIPIVHGMTLGELAKMINREGWLKNKVNCELIIVPVKGWDHQKPYSLPVRPSPNLPNDQSIALYPSLCLFEGTIVSVGRGTDNPFTQIGHPAYPDSSYSFIPVSRKESVYPKHEGKTCYGIDLSTYRPEKEINLDYLIRFYGQLKEEKKPFFKKYFTNLAGTTILQEQIENGIDEQTIRASWKKGLDAFKKKRKKYLLYADIN